MRDQRRGARLAPMTKPIAIAIAGNANNATSIAPEGAAS